MKVETSFQTARQLISMISTLLPLSFFRHEIGQPGSRRTQIHSAARTHTDPYPVMGFIAEANVSEPLAWDGKPEICWPHLGKQELSNTS